MGIAGDYAFVMVRPRKNEFSTNEHNGDYFLVPTNKPDFFIYFCGLTLAQPGKALAKPITETKVRGHVSRFHGQKVQFLRYRANL